MKIVEAQIMEQIALITHRWTSNNNFETMIHHKRPSSPPPPAEDYLSHVFFTPEQQASLIHQLLSTIEQGFQQPIKRLLSVNPRIHHKFRPCAQFFIKKSDLEGYEKATGYLSNLGSKHSEMVEYFYEVRDSLGGRKEQVEERDDMICEVLTERVVEEFFFREFGLEALKESLKNKQFPQQCAILKDFYNPLHRKLGKVLRDIQDLSNQQGRMQHFADLKTALVGCMDYLDRVWGNYSAQSLDLEKCLQVQVRSEETIKKLRGLTSNIGLTNQHESVVEFNRRVNQMGMKVRDAILQVKYQQIRQLQQSRSSSFVPDWLSSLKNKKTKYQKMEEEFQQKYYVEDQKLKEFISLGKKGNQQGPTSRNTKDTLRTQPQTRLDQVNTQHLNPTTHHLSSQTSRPMYSTQNYSESTQKFHQKQQRTSTLQPSTNPSITKLPPLKNPAQSLEEEITNIDGEIQQLLSIITHTETSCKNKVYNFIQREFLDQKKKEYQKKIQQKKLIVYQLNELTRRSTTREQPFITKVVSRRDVGESQSKILQF